MCFLKVTFNWSREPNELSSKRTGCENCSKVMKSGKLMSLTKTLYSLHTVVEHWWISKVLTTYSILKRRIALHFFNERSDLADIPRPRSGQKAFFFFFLRTRAPPAHQTLNKNHFSASFLFYHTRSSHAGYASAISMQPVVWPVWRRTHKRGAPLS